MTSIYCLFDTSMLPSFKRCVKFSAQACFPSLTDEEYYPILCSTTGPFLLPHSYSSKYDRMVVNHYCRVLCIYLFATDIRAMLSQVSDILSLRVYLHYKFITQYPESSHRLLNFWIDFVLQDIFDEPRPIKDLLRILQPNPLTISAQIRNMMNSRLGIIPVSSRTYGYMEKDSVLSPNNSSKQRMGKDFIKSLEGGFVLDFEPEHPYELCYTPLSKTQEYVSSIRAPVPGRMRGTRIYMEDLNYDYTLLNRQPSPTPAPPLRSPPYIVGELNRLEYEKYMESFGLNVAHYEPPVEVD